MLDLFQRGGIIMYIIGACSVVALAVFLERMWSLQRQRVVPPAFVQKIRELLIAGRIAEALVLCQEHSSSVAAVFAAGLRRSGQARHLVKEAIQDVGRHEAASLERFLGIIGTIAAIAPLLGLLGTVTGMIRVFQDITVSGVGNPADLASGIWEALITTAYGLVVAIPALVAYRYLASRADRLVLEMEEDALVLVDILEHEEASPTLTNPAQTAVPAQ